MISKLIKMTWPTKKLGEVIEINYGKGLPKESRIDSGKYFAYGSNGPVYGTDKSLTKSETIIIGRKGTAGALYFISDPCWPIDTTFFAKPKSDVSLKFIYYLLRTKKLPRLAIVTGVPGINRTTLANINVQLPPPETQKQIVEKLDKIFEVQKLNGEIIQKTDELFQSLLHKELNPAGKDWEVKKLVEVADFLDNLRKPVTASDRVSGPYPYYGANGQQDSVGDYIFDDELVLLAEDGGYFGSKTRPVAYRVSGKCWINNHAHVLKNKNEVSDIDFLGYSLMFYDVTPYVTGSTRAKLNKSAAEKIKIYLPSLKIQKQIVVKLSAVQDYKKQLLEQKTKLKELFDSALANLMKA